MTWTQSIADSLGVADEGLRLILGQLSGKPILFSNQVFYFRSDIFFPNHYQVKHVIETLK